jgi:hypothetical protein
LPDKTLKNGTTGDILRNTIFWSKKMGGLYEKDNSFDYSLDND